MPIDWSFISAREGDRLTGYVPTKDDEPMGHSGVTVAEGIDLGQYRPEEIDAMALAPDLKAMLKPYCLLRGDDALAFLRDNPLILTQERADELDTAEQVRFTGELAAEYQKYSAVGFTGLSDAAQTCIASVAWQYGVNLAKETPKFWGYVTKQRWADAVYELRHFGDTYAPRRNLEADLLETVLS